MGPTAILAALLVMLAVGMAMIWHGWRNDR